MTLASVTHLNIKPFSSELNMDDINAKLLTEQINRLKDIIESRFQKMETLLDNHCTLENEKLDRIWSQFKAENEILTDHEKRLRDVDDMVISTRAGIGLIQAGQAALTLIAATIAAWLGGRK